MHRKLSQIERTQRLVGNLTLAAIILTSLIVSAPALAEDSKAQANEASNAVFKRISIKADAEKWKTLPIGELMGKIATELEGTQYVGGVLDRSPNQEVCTVDLTSLDCVTFF